MPKSKSKKAARAAARADHKEARRAGAKTKAERHAIKLQRRRSRKEYHPDEWLVPPPSHLVAKLDVPKVKSKHQSYFEFADNTEKKKKLEFQVTDKQKPPPGFAFVPIGDPALTNACKELSREKDAMIFIVSSSKEENSKISEHVHRTGYHFRQSIVEEARDILGETVISRPRVEPGFIEPIPESQEEINKQADAAIRDLFPRIPNTDRTMIIEHAFRKGALFHGEPTVGLQANIALSRRVQLAVLAHIRHTHTRYDMLLRETSWMNARKAVEPVCLDVLVKWRGDEETGRDQMDEILREVVIITDSEDEEGSSDDESSDDDDGEVTSASSTEGSSKPASRNEQRPLQLRDPNNSASRAGQGINDIINPIPVISSRTGGIAKVQDTRDKRAQRGFKRYQAAWDEALHRRQAPPSQARDSFMPRDDLRLPPTTAPLPAHDVSHTALSPQYIPHPNERNHYDSQSRHTLQPVDRNRPISQGGYAYHESGRPAPAAMIARDDLTREPNTRGYCQGLPRVNTPAYYAREARPPPVVRASPPRHNLQDMLVSSIETTPNKLLGTESTRSAFNGWERVPQSGRISEHPRPYPAQRQVIVIDDSPPQVKRRRVVDEGFDRVSSFPDNSRYVQSQHPDSLMSSSRQAVRVPDSSHHGPFKSAPAQWTNTAQGERLPVYDAPESGFFSAHPSQLSRPEVGYAPSSVPLQNHDNFHDRSYNSRPVIARPYNDGMGVRDYGPRQIAEHAVQGSFQRPTSPRFPVQHSVSESYDRGPIHTSADQEFVRSFSQTRITGPPVRPNGEINMHQEQPRYDSTVHGRQSQRYGRPEGFSAPSRQMYHGEPHYEQYSRPAGITGSHSRLPSAQPTYSVDQSGRRIVIID